MAIASALAVLSLAWFLLARPGFAGKTLLLAASAPLFATALWIGNPGELSGDQRWTFFSTTWTAIGDHWVTGTGLGTFEAIYASYEAQQEISRTYANHAHNDYLEVILETGVAGGVLIALFAGIVLANGGRTKLSQAAFIAVAALMVHSMVDYPLRTLGVAVPFAWMCAVIASANAGSRRMPAARESAAPPEFVGIENLIAQPHGR
jgi:O-antigen ligase